MGRLAATRRDGREAMTLEWAVAHGLKGEKGDAMGSRRGRVAGNGIRNGKLKSKMVKGPALSNSKRQFAAQASRCVAGRICNRPLGRNRLCLDGPRACWALFGNVPMRGL